MHESYFLHHPDEADGEEVRGVKIEKIENPRVPAPVPAGRDDLVRKSRDEAKETCCLGNGDLFARRKIGLRLLFPVGMRTDADEAPAGIQSVVDSSNG